MPKSKEIKTKICMAKTEEELLLILNEYENDIKESIKDERK